MRYSEYLVHSSELIFKPDTAIKNLFLRYKKEIFQFGLISFITGNVASILANVLLKSGQTNINAGALVSLIITTLLLILLLQFVHVAIINLVVNLSKITTEIQEFSGLFLGMDSLLILSLPFALLFYHLKFLPVELFYFLYFVLVVFIFYLRIKVLNIVTGISKGAAFGLMILPETGIFVMSLILLIRIFTFLG